MLRLWRENGGNAWLRRFFDELQECPEAPENTREGAQQQCWYWYLSASVGAQRDLSSVFVDDWRMPVDAETRKALAAMDWKKPGLTPPMVDREVKTAAEPHR